MTDIGFYHLLVSPLERALPRLLEKMLEAGGRAVILAGSEERVKFLNAHLWTYDPKSFLPHGAAEDGEAARQPIYLTTEDENPNTASVLFLLDGMNSDRLATYARCLDLFDGRDEAAVVAARERWRAATAAGHGLTYWRQTEGGGWEKQASA
ncbi:MAG: DNA polymerase III subunit chi [Alphaproteobacteria bacterium]